VRTQLFRDARLDSKHAGEPSNRHNAPAAAVAGSPPRRRWQHRQTILSGYLIDPGVDPIGHTATRSGSKDGRPRHGGVTGIRWYVIGGRACSRETVRVTGDD